MNVREVLGKLEALGTAQNRKVYARHGVAEPLFGVSYAHQNALRKEIGTDHALAVSLWKSGNHDARVLATMVADPERVDARLLDAWARDLDDYVLTDALSVLAARSPAARGRMEKWIGARREWTAAAGWSVLAGLVPTGILAKAELEELLEHIEAGIHGAPNRTRYSMNTALIAIGCAPGMEARAVAAARRIGPVEVDHGETGCRTPDAVTYIPKAAAHARKKAAKRAGKAGGRSKAKARSAPRRKA